MITLNINENRTVTFVQGNEDFVQGDCCATEFAFNFPATIKGVAVSQYEKTIEFGECKEFGECVKFVDEIVSDTYDLKEFCTCFKKILVQIVLTRIDGDQKTVWKTIPFILSFHESVNAEATPAVQSQLLSLTAIKDEWVAEMDATREAWTDDLTETREAWTEDLTEAKAAWEAFVNANCIQVIKASANIPSPENCDCGVMFYLGVTTGGYTYGHYYKAVEREGVWIWEDINPETTVTDVANGIRELNKNRVIQLFKGTIEEYNADENTHENVLFLPEGTTVLEEIEDEFNKIYDGETTVGKAENATSAANAEKAEKVITGTITVPVVSGCGDFLAEEYATLKNKPAFVRFTYTKNGYRYCDQGAAFIAVENTDEQLINNTINLGNTELKVATDGDTAVIFIFSRNASGVYEQDWEIEGEIEVKVFDTAEAVTT